MVSNTIDFIFRNMSSLSDMEKFIQINIFLLGISILVLLVIFPFMLFVTGSRTYSQLISAIKLFCFILSISLVSLAFGYIFVDSFAEEVNKYLVL